MNQAHTHRIPIVLALVVLAFCGRHGASAHDELQRGGVDQVATDLQFSRFSLDLTVGFGGSEGIDDFQVALTVAPRFDLLRRAGQLYALSLPLIWIPEEQEFPNDDPFGVGDLAYEEGPSVILAPTFEWYSCPDLCLRPSTFIGAGVRYDKRSSPLFEVDDATSPVVTIGFAFERPVTPRSALRFETRALMTFYGAPAIESGSSGDYFSSRGAPIESDGMEMSIFVSVGLKLNPGR